MTLRRPAISSAALLSLSMMLTCAGGAQNKAGKADPADSPAKWDSNCTANGCLLQTDVLRGVSDDPPDPKDFREYVGIDVALYRSLTRTGYISFLVDPRVQSDQGVFITFSKTTAENGELKMNVDPEGPERLPITDCNTQACTARVQDGMVDDAPDRHKMDILEKLLSSDHLLVLYVKDGKAYGTMVPLSSFKEEYLRLMTTELRDSRIIH